VKTLIPIPSPLFLLLLLALLDSCKRENISPLSATSYYTGISARINEIQIIHDSLWVACAGIRNESGYFLHSTDSGKSWISQQTEFERSVYTLEIADNGQGLAGGDFLDLWTTDDFGKTWQYLWLGNEVPFNEEDRPGVRDISIINDSIWHFCGGENLGEGVIYRTVNAGNSWSFAFHQNEFRTIAQNVNNETVVGGHGKVLSFTDDVDQVMVSGFQDSFMTSMITTKRGEFIATCFDGKVIKSVDGGQVWIEIFDINRNFNKRINWNKIIIGDSIIACFGTRGFLALSYNQGKNWLIEKIDGDKNLLSGALLRDKILAGDSEGNIHLIEYPNQ
jgi:photosystem II stability/assembly factor-like uncharacterized protein